MTARQPRRTRRRTAPATSLPRPSTTTEAYDSQAPRTGRRSPIATRPREHHVTTDYSYVRKDLLLIAAVSAVSLGFIAAMWAIL